MRHHVILRRTAGPRVAPTSSRVIPDQSPRPRRWLISIPAWGDEFVGRLAASLPGLRVAAAQVGEPTVLITHTDNPERLTSTERLPIVAKPVPEGRQWFDRMSAAHADVLRQARPGEIVVLLTADMIVSDNAFAACRNVFASGKKIVCCNATRAIADLLPPEGGTSRELSEWGWRHRHHITRNCTWPDGQIDDLSRVYFENGPNVACRLWLAHPLAVVIDGRPLPFKPTIDCDLVCNFRKEEIHVSTSPDELAVLELSPAAKRFGSRDADEPPARTDLGPLWKRYGKGPPLAPPLYRWILSHRIVVAGTGEDCGDEIVERLIA
jgi:hypothetical protein